MAEGFANHYGSDVLCARSAGIAPVPKVIQPTVVAMAEKNIDISMHVPRFYDPLSANRYDLVVNMSGYKLPGAQPKNFQDWVVTDPYQESKAVYRTVRDDLEHRVMMLILQFRRNSK